MRHAVGRLPAHQATGGAAGRGADRARQPLRGDGKGRMAVPSHGSCRHAGKRIVPTASGAGGSGCCAGARDAQHRHKRRQSRHMVSGCGFEIHWRQRLSRQYCGGRSGPHGGMAARRQGACRRHRPCQARTGLPGPGPRRAALSRHRQPGFHGPPFRRGCHTRRPCPRARTHLQPEGQAAGELGQEGAGRGYRLSHPLAAFDGRFREGEPFRHGLGAQPGAACGGSPQDGQAGGGRSRHAARYSALLAGQPARGGAAWGVDVACGGDGEGGALRTPKAPFPTPHLTAAPHPPRLPATMRPPPSASSHSRPKRPSSSWRWSGSHALPRPRASAGG